MFRVLSPLIGVLVLAAATSPFSPAMAQSSDLYVVRDVPLDSRAQTAQAARNRALADGQTRALEIILKRLTLSRDWIALPEPAANAASSMVSSIQINDEKIAAGTYQADLTVEFEPSSVRNLLRRNGIAFSEARYRPVLILPVYAAGGLVSYDYGANPLRDAWAEIARNPGLIPYRLAGVDGVPRVSFPADRAMDLSPETVQRMHQRTETAAVIAVRVDVLSRSDARPRIRLTLRDYSETLGAEGTNSEFLYAEGGETLPELVERATRTAATVLEDHWKSQTLARFEERSNLAVDVPLTSLVQWRDILARLNDNILIDQVDIRSLASDRAELLVHVLGPVSQLKLSLAQDNLMLEEAEITEDASGGKSRWRLSTGTRPGG